MCAGGDKRVRGNILEQTIGNDKFKGKRTDKGSKNKQKKEKRVKKKKTREKEKNERTKLRDKNDTEKGQDKKEMKKRRKKRKRVKQKTQKLEKGGDQEKEKRKRRSTFDSVSVGGAHFSKKTQIKNTQEIEFRNPILIRQSNIVLAAKKSNKLRNRKHEEEKLKEIKIQ